MTEETKPQRKMQTWHDHGPGEDCHDGCPSRKVAASQSESQPLPSEPTKGAEPRKLPELSDALSSKPTNSIWSALSILESQVFRSRDLSAAHKTILFAAWKELTAIRESQLLIPGALAYGTTKEEAVEKAMGIAKEVQGAESRVPAQPVSGDTRFADFDDASHPFRKWWNEHGQYMMSGGGRRQSIWAARGWIAHEQLASGIEVTGDSLAEARRAAPSPEPPTDTNACTCPCHQDDQCCEQCCDGGPSLETGSAPPDQHLRDMAADLNDIS